jgi:hypothetical protein
MHFKKPKQGYVLAIQLGVKTMPCKELKFSDYDYFVTGKLLPSNELLLRLESRTFRTSIDAKKNKRTTHELEAYVDFVNNQKHEHYDSLEQWKEAHSKDLASYRKDTKKDKVGYGLIPNTKIFNNRMKNNIRRLASGLDKEYKRKEMLFLTATIPGSTERTAEVTSAYSSYIVDRINRFFSINLGKDYSYIFVWENHNSKKSKAKKGHLHLHIIVASKCKDELHNVKTKFKKQWIKIIDDIETKFNNQWQGIVQVDMWEKYNGKTHRYNKEVVQTKVEYVTKSVGAYLSKYLSKGNNNNCSTRVFNPVRWYTYNRKVKTIFNKYVQHIKSKRLSIEDAKDLINEIKGNARYICHTRYNKPLIYNDKFSNSINIRLIVNTQKCTNKGDKIIDILVPFIDSIIEEYTEKKIEYGSIPKPSKDCMDARKDDLAYEELFGKDYFTQFKNNIEKRSKSLRIECDNNGNIKLFL